MPTDRRFRFALFVLPLALAIASINPVVAQSSAPPPAAPARPPACQEPERRQFDFWIGDWDVALADGTVRGRNVIEAIEGGCALRESYTAGRYSGTSYNFYDVARARWHQTWIDNQGSPLYLEGGLENGRMVLSGEAAGARHRITWAPLDDGRVRQLWESSSDGGTSWTVAFDGYYSRRP